jgi:hypothetical protein
LVVTIHNLMPENVVFKVKKPPKNKGLANWQEKEMLQCLFEEAIMDIQEKEPPIQTSVKPNLTKNFNLNIKNQLFEFIIFTSILVLSNLTVLPDL